MNKAEFTLLIAEDQKDIQKLLYQGLTEDGYECFCATNGEEVLEIVKKKTFHLILLDWMMPKIQGIDVCKQLRAQHDYTPIIFLTAKDTVEDTIEGLKSGANDYVKKPFNFEELLARIEAQIRSHFNIDEILEIGKLQINMSKHEIILDNNLVNLTEKEFKFLAFLVRNKGNVCDRQSIIEQVWDIHFDYDTGVLDVYMNAIRKKLQLEKNELIKTIRGVGFMAIEE